MSQTYLDPITGGMSSIENQSAIQSILDAQSLAETAAPQVEDEDIFQCGKCRKQFTSLTLFVNHKAERCTPVAPRALVQNTTLLQGIGTSAFTAIGVQNGIRTQPLPQVTLGGFTAVSQSTIPQLTQNIVLPEEQLLSFTELAQPVQNGIVQGSTIHLAPATNAVQTNGRYLSQVTRLAPRPSNNITNNMTILSTIQPSIQPSTSLSPSADSAFTSTVSVNNLQPLVQPQQIAIATALPEKPQNVQIIKPSPTKQQGVTFERIEPVVSQSEIASRIVTVEEKKKLNCHYCGKEFSKNFDLQQHVRSHTGEKPFQCVVCGRAFAQKSNVKKHMSTHKVWPTGPGMTLPVQPPATLVPLSETEPDVEQPCQTTITLKDPVARDHNIGDQNLPTLNGPFSGTEDEAPNAKGDNKSGKSGENKGSYKLKVVIDNSFMCQYCPEKFKTYYQLKSHMVNHKNVQVYKCVIKDCPETFKTLETFLDHVENHREEMTYRCHQCSKVFNTLYELGVHQYTHGLYENASKTGPSHFQCSLCLNRYATPEALAHHMNTTSHDFLCPHCGKKFTCERFLRKHLTSHGTENLHQCPTCNKTFKTEHYLKNHMLIHTGEKPYSCDQCGASFNRKDKLKRHYLIHDKQAKFKCPFQSVCGCTKEFSRPDKLKSHLLTHSCIKPFACHICGHEFARRPHFNEHMRSHRGDYPYNCTKCKKGFFRPKLFKEHRCNDKAEHSSPNRLFKPRRMKRKPGRPRKIVQKATNTSVPKNAKEINVVNQGNLRENRKVIEKVVRDSQDEAEAMDVGTRKGKRKPKARKNIDKDMVDIQIKQEQNTESSEQIEDSSNVEMVSETVDVQVLEGGDASSSNMSNIVFINTLPETKPPKKAKPECYVKAPPASMAGAITPLSMVERYITVQLTTTNNADGSSEIQTQLIPAGDLGSQLQFPAGSLDLPNAGLHPIQIIEGQPLTLTEGQPLTLTVSQGHGDQLGDVNVGEQNVIDIPVDIVTVSNDQALVCTQEVSNAGVVEETGQVYSIEDYETAETVLHGSENLIDSTVEILGPDGNISMCQ